MGFDVLLPLIAGLTTAVLGLLTSILSGRYQERARHQEETLDRLARTVASRFDVEPDALLVQAAKAPLDDRPRGADESEDRAGVAGPSDRGVIVDPRTPQGEHEGGTWEIVEDLVQGYHRQALDQAKVQFHFSVAAATAGFGLIIYMVTTADTTGSTQVLLETLPGAVISVVAALFFRQAGATRQRATALYDRLRSDNQKRHAVSLVTSIENQTMRSLVKAQLVLHMAGLDVSNLDLAEFVHKIREPAQPVSMLADKRQDPGTN